MQGGAYAFGPQTPGLPSPYSPNVFHGGAFQHAIYGSHRAHKGENTLVTRVFLGHMGGDLGQGTRGPHAYRYGNARPALHALAYLAAKFRQIRPLRGIKPHERLVDGIGLDLRAILLENARYTRRDITVQSVVGRKNCHVQLLQLGPQLEFGRAHGNAQSLGLCRPGNYAAVVV